MPRIKTHRGTVERVKRTGSGQLKRSRAFIPRLFTNKNTKQKHQLCKAKLVPKSDMKRIKQLLTCRK